MKARMERGKNHGPTNEPVSGEYLIWFDPPHQPEKATEHILFFRDGRPIIRQIRPGAFLEAIQACDWTERYVGRGGARINVELPAAGSVPAKSADLTSKELVAEVKAIAQEKRRLFEGNPTPRTDLRYTNPEPFRHLDTRRQIVESALLRLRVAARPSNSVTAFLKDWGTEDFPDGLWWAEPELVKPREEEPIDTKRDIEQYIALLLAEDRDVEPSPTGRGGKMLFAMRPQRRYDFIRDVAETRDVNPWGISVASIHETVYINYHVFPWKWLERFGLKKTSSHCFYAQDWWTAAMIEIVWAMEHDVRAGRCRFRDEKDGPECGVRFLRSRRRGKKRIYCERHRGIGPAKRRRQRMTPDEKRIESRLTVLRRQLREGRVTRAEFEKQSAALRQAQGRKRK